MKSISILDVQAFLYYESRLLDEEQWDEWLTLYDENVEFWMPSWDDDDKLVTNPNEEISLIYYPSKAGLEDRIFRIKTERSSATMPDTRTCHNITNVEIERQEGEIITVRFNWLTMSHRYKTNYTYFGKSKYVVDFSGDKPLIKNKYVVLKNDYIHQVIDIYHI